MANHTLSITVVKKRPGVPDESYPQEFVMFKLTEVTSFVSPPPVDLTSVCNTKNSHTHVLHNCTLSNATFPPHLHIDAEGECP